MTPPARLPWKPEGARLHLPRDVHAAYVVGRMGAATSYDLWPLLYGSHAAGKFGFARLQRLGLLRMFPRRSPSELGWFSVTAAAAPWVADAMGCDEREIRVVHGVARANLAAVRQRNRLWVSTVLACRARGDARVASVRPEWELRAAKGPGTRLVPDMLLVLECTPDGAAAREAAWFVELDGGTERAKVWEAKMRAYARARADGALFGERDWRVLAVVPSARRARTVAAAASLAGEGAGLWVGLHDGLDGGRALEPALWRSDELREEPAAAPRWTLLGAATPIRDSGPRPRSAAERGSEPGSPEVPS